LQIKKIDYRFNEKEKNELEIRFKWLLLIKECFNCLDILFNISSVYLMMQYIYSIITESDGLIEGMIQISICLLNYLDFFNTFKTNR